jgi:peptidyl-prolyl cis-trans isomerase SurA
MVILRKPFLTNYGYHIVKRLEWNDIQPFESMKKEIQNKVNRDDRAKLTQNYFVDKLKKEYNFKDKSAKSIKWFETNVDTNYFIGQWDYKSLTTNDLMFELAGKPYTQQQFAIFLQMNKNSAKRTEPKIFVDQQYKNWQKEVVLEYENSRLEEKHPEFKALMQEYHDGILLYEIMTDKVWNKASTDTSGLNRFYEANKNKYKWNDRIDAVVFECASKDIADKTYKIISKNDTISPKKVMEKLNIESELNLRFKINKFEVESTPYLATQKLVKGANKPFEYDGKIYVVKVVEFLPARHKEIGEAKGAITSDYQNKLEKDWLNELSIKYQVKINNDVLYSLGNK